MGGAFALLPLHRPEQAHRPLLLHHLPRLLIQFEHGAFVTLLNEHTLADQLVDPVAHLDLGAILQKPVGGELLVAEAAHLVGLGAAEDVDDVLDAELLLDAVDA